MKAPKLHFVDSGLACHLLGITSPDQLRHHPLRGEIFESWVAAEILKTRAHRGLPSRLHHFRDAKGLEVDLVVEAEEAFELVEVKAGARPHPEFVRPLARLGRLVAEREGWKPVRELLVYGGDRAATIGTARVVPWSALDAERW